MKQNEAARWRMSLLAGACMILGLAGVAALPVIALAPPFAFIFTTTAAEAAILGGIFTMVAGVASFLWGCKLLVDLVKSKTNEPSLGDSLAADSSLSPAGVADLTVHADKANGLVSKYSVSAQVQPEAGVAGRLEGERAPGFTQSK